MTTVYTWLCVAALGLAACSEGEDAPTDVSSELGGPTRLPLDPRSAGLCASAPAAHRGEVFWTDESGLWTASSEPTSVSAGVLRLGVTPGQTAQSPVVLRGSKAIVALATSGEGRCELSTLEPDAPPRARVEIPALACGKPSALDGHVLWPIAESETAGRVVVLANDNLEEVTSLALGGAPLTAAVVVGRDGLQGGGSHWLVGTTRGYELLTVTEGRPSLTALPPVDEPGGRIAALVAAGEHIGAVLEAAPGGLGAHVRALTLGEGGLALGALVEAPGALTTHPVLIDCEASPEAPLCAKRAAVLVAGGAGWLAGWDLADGSEVVRRDTPLTWTGLTLGRGGWVAGGGSHWLPTPEDPVVPGWALVSFDPLAAEAPRMLARGDEGDCVPSPLVDTDGVVQVPLEGVGELVRGVLSGLEGRLALGAGSPRPHGDNANSGAAAPRHSECGDGVERGVVVTRLDGEVISNGLAHADGVTYLWGERGGRGWVRFSSQWDAQGEVLLEPGTRIEQLTPMPGPSFAVVYHDLATQTHVLRLGGPFASWSEPQQLSGGLGAILGLVPTTSDEFVVGSPGTADTLTRVSASRGVIEVQRFEAPTHPVGLVRLLSDGRGGVLMVLNAPGELFVRRLGPELEPLGELRWPTGDDTVVIYDASVDGHGELRVMLELQPEAGPAEVRWLHISAGLALLDARPMPFGGYFATRPDGVSLVQSVAGLVRVAASGAVGLPHPSGLGFGPGLRSVVATETGFVTAFEREGERGPEYALAFTDELGFFACGAAGRCLGEPAGACDDDTVCAVSGCAPQTGACASSPAVFECTP